MKVFSKFFLLLFVLLQLSVVVLSRISCRDENNNEVPWLYMYKLPKNKFSKDSLIKQGVGYLYITPNTLQNGWTLSAVSINSSNSIPGLTLDVLYKNSDFMSVIYNDQPPDDGNKNNTSGKLKQSKSLDYDLEIDYSFYESHHKISKRDVKKIVRAHSLDGTDKDDESRKARPIRMKGGGHTKGVIVSDNKSGIWLIHSVPKYPPLPVDKKVKYSYPTTATKFGQSFLCLSLNSTQIELVGQQLKYNEPKIIYKNMPLTLMNQFKSVVDVINGQTVKSAPWYHITNLTTINGVKFTSFAKSAKFNDDIYEALVAQTIRTDMLVESWINGPGVLKSNCTFKYRVNNINKIAFLDKSIAFSSHSDHSKWAISVPKVKSCKTCNKDHWICVGDINRAEKQEVRGGGTVCIQNKDLWSQYNKLVNEIEECGGDVKQRLSISYINNK